MSISPLDPPGIDAAGNAKLFFVPAIADLDAPTVAEITAGTELSCALYGFSPSMDQSASTRAKYCYKQVAQTAGRAQYSIDAIEYDYNPQDLSDADYAYYADLTPGLRGFIVERRGIDHATAVASGDIVDIYPVELGERVRVAIDPTSTDDQKLRTRQPVFVVGDVKLDVAIAGA